MDKNSLRPVLIKNSGKSKRGYFHRFIYNSDRNFSTTLALIELDDGHVKIYDPEHIQFIDRKPPENKETKSGGKDLGRRD